jgi:hypothetical protein
MKTKKTAEYPPQNPNEIGRLGLPQLHAPKAQGYRAGNRRTAKDLKI